MAATKSAKPNRVKVQKTISDLNYTLIRTSEDLIEGTIHTGEKYQKLFAKTLRKGEPVLSRQVDLVFDTLEGIKDQFEYGGTRFRKLIGWNDTTLKNWKKNAEKRVKKFKEEAEERIGDIQEDLNIFQLPGKKTREKAITKNDTKRSSAAKTVAKKVRKSASASSKKNEVNTDLKVIKGVGPAMEKILKSSGIDSVETLATSTKSKLAKIVEKAGPRFRMIDPTDWIKQAKAINKK